MPRESERGWLTRDGLAASLAVGGAVTWGLGWPGLALLAGFFLSGSLLTQWAGGTGGRRGGSGGDRGTGLRGGTPGRRPGVSRPGGGRRRGNAGGLAARSDRAGTVQMSRVRRALRAARHGVPRAGAARQGQPMAGQRR